MDKKERLGISAAIPRPAYCAFCVLVSLFCALYLELMVESTRYTLGGIESGILFGVLTPAVFLRLGAITFILLLCLLAISSIKGAFGWMVRHRWQIGGAVLCALVLFEVSGSSLAYWNTILGVEGFSGTIFGMPRAVRADEWLVFTPFSLSQQHAGYSPVNDIIRAADTNVTMVYAQPNWSISTLFRPFLWGHLMLGPSRGLSLFWCGRTVVLVLTTFELLKLLTNGKERLSAYGAVLVGFAPIVEWWFAVNGTAELFIFGQGLVLSLHHLLRSKSPLQRWGWSLLLGWLLGCYALIIYPAWQIPFVYVFGALGVWDLLGWIDETEKGTRLPQLLKILAPLAISVVVFASGVIFSLLGARDAIQAVSQTDYPGQRFDQGGGYDPLVFGPITAIVSAIWPESYPPNVCERSAFVSLFPLGIILALVMLVRSWRNGSLDKALLALLLVYGFLFAFGVVGFPAMLAKITLMSNVTENRLPLPLGYLDVLLLVRAASLLLERESQLASSISRKAESRRASALSWIPLLIWAFALVCLILIARDSMSELMSARATVLLAIALGILLLPFALPSKVCDAGTPHGRETWIVTSALVVFVAGMCVNPTQIGTGPLTKNANLDRMAEVASEEEHPQWITDNVVLGQLCVSQGIPTISCVHTYPDLARWKQLDPDGVWKECYNRYAHISVTLGNETSFELTAPDSFILTIRPDDVWKLGATSWLSTSDLSAWNTERTTFEPVATFDTLTVFRIRQTTQDAS